MPDREKYNKYDLCPNNSILLTTSSDSKIEFWKTDDNRLLQEYLLPTHLSSQITSIRWANPTIKERTLRSKKRTHQPNAESDLVALGLKNGSIFIYSYIQGEILEKLPDEHKDIINDINWDTNNVTLYSCSNDKYINIYNIKENCLIKKWQADEYAITSIRLCLETDYLLSANRNIKLWNIKNQQIIRTFIGHIEPINYIIILNHENSLSMSEQKSSNEGTKEVTPLKKKLRSNKQDTVTQTPRKVDDSHVEPPMPTILARKDYGFSHILTSSQLEKDIKVWNLNDPTADIIPNSTFLAESEIRYIDDFSYPEDEATTYLVTVSKLGSMQIFRSSIDKDKKGKPIHPLNTVTIMVPKGVKARETSAPVSKASQQLPIICARFITPTPAPTSTEVDKNLSHVTEPLKVLVCYLEPFTQRPQFVTLNVAELKDGDNTIYKEHEAPKSGATSQDGLDTSINITAHDSQIKTIVDPKATMTLDSRIRDLLANRSSISHIGKKRKHENKGDHGQDDGGKGKGGTHPQPPSSVPNFIPKADSLVALVTQCLQAGDRNKLWNLLQTNNENVIRETVKRLPIRWICPLIAELGNRMTFAKINELKPTLIWFDNVLLHHASYLISTPQVHQDLLSIHELMLDRTSIFPKLMQLKGKLGHLVQQANLRKENAVTSKTVTLEDASDPTLIYYEESDTELDEGVGSDLMI